MLRHSIFTAILLAATSTALADPWKDESGKGGDWKGGDWREGKGDWKDKDGDEGWGETPWWGRGRGYWDGHFKEGYGPRNYVQPGYYPRGSYGYGRGYGYGGYRGGTGYGSGYGGYYDDEYDVQPGISIPGLSLSFSVDGPYDGPGVAICNKADVELSFTIDDRRQMRIAPGETLRLTNKGQFVISFDRGSGFGSARYAIREGRYDFTPTNDGWELYRQKANDALSDQPNPAVTPRTAQRPRAEELPPPREERDFDRPMRDAELPPRPRPY